MEQRKHLLAQLLSQKYSQTGGLEEEPGLDLDLQHGVSQCEVIGSRGQGEMEAGHWLWRPSAAK